MSIISLRQRPAIFVASAVVALGLVFGDLSSAAAIKPARKFRGRIILSTERFPSQFHSDRQFIHHMKKVNTHQFTAKGDEDWTFEYMAFLPSSVSTLKAAVTYYDVTVPGQRKMINTFAFYPADRKDKILAGHAELSTKRFQSNHKYLMVFSRGYGQRALAKTRFVLQRTGDKKKKDSGVVDFTKGE